MKWVGLSDIKYKKMLDSYHLYCFFLKTVTDDWSWRLVVTLVDNKCCSQKDGRQKNRFSIASKGVDLSSDI